MTMKSKTKKEVITLETLVVACWYNDNYNDNYDDDYAYGQGKQSVESCTIGKLIENYPDDASEWTGNYQPLDNEHPENLLEFLYITAQNNEFNVMLQSEWEAQQAQKELDSMNRLAASFAKEWNVTAGTMEFIEQMYKEMDKLNYEVERYNDYECRAERWMDSRYSGQSYEGYCSDEDYGQSKFSNRADDLERIRKWLCLNCPVTMALHAERMLVQAANGNDEDEE
jgi:hypothetical protein